MKSFLKNSLIILLLLIPSFSANWWDDPEQVKQRMYETPSIINFFKTLTDPVGMTIGQVFKPVMEPASKIAWTISDVLSWIITVVRLIFTLSLAVILQILIVKFWVIVIKTFVKMFAFYKILTAPKSDLGDILEVISLSGKELSDSVKHKITKSNSSVGLIAKLFAFLS